MGKVTQNRMIRFYTPEEARHENMRDPHHYIALDFNTFVVGNIRESKSTIDVKRDSVVVGNVNVEGKQYNAYATVTAKFTQFRREISSSGTLSVRVIDAASKKIIGQRAFSGQYVWATVWGSYTGDDRALSKDQKSASLRQPQLPPPEQEFFIEFTKPIYSQVVEYIHSIYYRM
jgi:hypothetical protein